MSADPEYGEEWSRTEQAPPTPDGARAWLVEAGKGLIDIRFRTVATRTLLPIVYVLLLFAAVVVPLAFAVPIFLWSVLAGLLYVVFVAPLLIISFAAVTRLLLEFLVNIVHVAGLFDDLHETLADAVDPISQLSEDFRAVQFWRFRERRATPTARRRTPRN